jgi:hypothetical protein
MLNFSSNITITTTTISSKTTQDSLSINFYLIIISDFIAILLRALLCIGMIKCQKQCYPFDVSCLIVANMSYNIAQFSWCIESFLKNIEPLKFSTSLGSLCCYLINSRQIFWILNNHSLVFLSFNRVYVIHQSLFNHKSLATNLNKSQSCLQRWKFPLLFHSVHTSLVLFVHVLGYLTLSVQFSDYQKCNRLFRPDYYQKLIYILKNLIPCSLMVLNYVVIIPAYLILHKRHPDSEIQKKRTNKAIKISLQHFAYALCETTSWSMSVGINEFILSKISISTSSASSRRLSSIFEISFGVLCNETVWWLELIAWVYNILENFNPLILIFLHNRLFNSIKQIVIDLTRFLI